MHLYIHRRNEEANQFLPSKKNFISYILKVKYSGGLSLLFFSKPYLCLLILSPFTKYELGSLFKFMYHNFVFLTVHGLSSLCGSQNNFRKGREGI